MCNDGSAFGRYYLIKDVLLLALAAMVLTPSIVAQPDAFADVELFVDVNTMSTPLHIVPEWYLLSYYATLRGIPNKLIGITSVAIMLMLVWFGILSMRSVVYMCVICAHVCIL